MALNSPSFRDPTKLKSVSLVNLLPSCTKTSLPLPWVCSRQANQYLRQMEAQDRFKSNRRTNLKFMKLLACW